MGAKQNKKVISDRISSRLSVHTNSASLLPNKEAAPISHNIVERIVYKGEAPSGADQHLKNSEGGAMILFLLPTLGPRCTLCSSMGGRQTSFVFL